MKERTPFFKDFILLMSMFIFLCMYKCLCRCLWETEDNLRLPEDGGSKKPDMSTGNQTWVLAEIIKFP